MTPEAREIFTRAEARAERVIGVLRVVIAGSLAIVLLLSMSNADLALSGVMKRQVAYAVLTMVSYFLVGLLILLIIRLGRFRVWMRWPSALADCAFILLGIWMSVFNLGMPGQFISALPTVWLIPVILACGALRFDPALLGAMSLLLVGGFLVMLHLPVPDSATTARTEIVQLFAMQPNYARTTMIALAALVLVIASMRIRALLIRSLEEADARGRLTRFLPQQLDDQLSQRGLEDMRLGSEQQLAVMFVDIRGFTRLSEQMNASDLSDFLKEYRRCITQAADKTGGIVDKFIGDGAMLVFGDADGTAAVRALQCAEAVLDAVASWRPNMRLGIGIHMGSAFAGVVGDEGRLEYTVLGDVVNVASRLEAAAKTEKCSLLVSDTVLENADFDRAGWRHIPALALPGRNATIGAWANM